MWTKITRKKYGREKLRFASDTTDAQWSVIEPLLPLPNKRGRPRTTPLREVVNALFYMAQSGCQWRMLPKEFPPYTAVQRYFYPWRRLGVPIHGCAMCLPMLPRRATSSLPAWLSSAPGSSRSCDVGIE